jgi:YVTN family beta-propeller protein
MRWLALLAVMLAGDLNGWMAEPGPLVLETRVALGEVKGRIDHLAADPGRQRLFVAELGNNTVGVIDLKERRVIRTIAGLREPQGVGYLPATDTLYVASAGDGSVRLFQGENLRSPGASILVTTPTTSGSIQKPRRYSLATGKVRWRCLRPAARRLRTFRSRGIPKVSGSSGRAGGFS